MGTSPTPGQRPRCAHGRCPNRARVGRHCDKHWRVLAAAGDAGLVDAAPARAHLVVLRGLGWTWEQIGAAAGCSRSAVTELHRGDHARARAATAAAVLAVPVGPARLGWPRAGVAAQAGTDRNSLTAVLHRGRISADLAGRIASVYTRLSSVPGPSHETAVRAAGWGWAAPWAWPEGSLDDPAARPRGRRDATARPAAVPAGSGRAVS